MSVTFSPASHRETAEYGTVIWAEESDLDVNVANARAATILQALGYSVTDEGYVGSAPVAEFIERLELASTALYLVGGDRGSDTVEYLARGDSGARVTDCGRPTAYLEVRYNQLYMLATFAKDTGAEMIAWA